MSKVQSVDREKFVVRFGDLNMRTNVQVAADKDHTSMNTFILQAIDEKLERGDRIDRLLDLAAIALDK